MHLLPSRSRLATRPGLPPAPANHPSRQRSIPPTVPRDRPQPRRRAPPRRARARRRQRRRRSLARRPRAVTSPRGGDGSRRSDSLSRPPASPIGACGMAPVDHDGDLSGRASSPSLAKGTVVRCASCVLGCASTSRRDDEPARVDGGGTRAGRRRARIVDEPNASVITPRDDDRRGYLLHRRGHRHRELQPLSVVRGGVHSRARHLLRRRRFAA